MPNSVLRCFMAVTGAALAVTACGAVTDKHQNTSSGPAAAPQALGSAIHVQGEVLSKNNAEFAGSVTVDSPPQLCLEPDSTQLLAFHVEVNATQGAIPTANWSVDTENAVPVPQESLNEAGIATPPLGPEVSDNAKGYITFKVPRRTKPTVLNLLNNYGPQGNKLARWSIGDLPSAQSCPPTAATTTRSPTP